jgi:hypothetical protein
MHAAAADRADAPRSISFRTLAVPDARRALDSGIDVVITADAAALEYGRALPDYAVTPLPWSRTYLLASRAQPDSAGVPVDALNALARDAVRADVRAATDVVPCPALSPSMPAAQQHNTLVYPREDAIARSIAERLVALAWPVARSPAWLRDRLPAGHAGNSAPAALGVSRTAFTDSLASGRGLAFVVPVDTHAWRSCDGAHAADALTAAILSSALHATPLLDARDHLLHHRDIGRVTIMGDGAILFGAGSR